MNTDDIANMRQSMLEQEVNPLLDEIQVEEVVEEKINDTFIDKIKSTLIKNSNNYISNAHSSATAPILTREIIGDITSQMVDAMAVSNFVGVQPMGGPVGLVYSLQYTEKDGDVVSLDINSNTVEACSRRLVAGLTTELMEDITTGGRNVIDLNIGNKFAQEIYEEIRDDISSIANKTTTNLEKLMDGITHISQRELDVLGLSIMKCSNDIAAKTRRGAGNFAIVSETIGKMLENNESFIVCDSDPAWDYGYVKYLGTLHGSVKIYCDFNLEQNKTIVGYKGGSGEIDTGYIYAPYVVLMTTGVVTDPCTLDPVMRFMTRHGKVAIQKQTETTTEDGLTSVVTREPCGYYVDMTITGLPDLDALKFKKKEKKEKKENGMNDLFDDAMMILD